MPILQLESGYFAAVLGVRARLGFALSFQARDLQFQLNELADGEARRDRIERGVRRDFILNVCFSRKRSFDLSETQRFDRPLSANSGRSGHRPNKHV
jgi:hypothetical protein